jgi:hypothetical protein
MHASPPFQMTVCRFGFWRTAVLSLAVLSMTTVGAWAPGALDFFAAWAVAAMVLVSALSVAVLLHAWRLQPVSLRWDTQRWYLGAELAPRREPPAGRLTVSMDLGVWMLLRFVPDDASLFQRGTWLPVQMRGHEAAWHALRCTVYCARPVSLPTAAPF